MNLEPLTKATQSADLLASDIREAHSRACYESPVAEILLLDCISEAVCLQQRLALILHVCQQVPSKFKA